MVTRRTASPRQSSTRRTPVGSRDDQVLAAVDAYLATLNLDEVGKARAAIARTLATKLDQARADTTGAVAMATSSLARELRETLEAIVEASIDNDEFVAGLFGGDGG